MKSNNADVQVVRPSQRRKFLFGLLGGGITLGMGGIAVNNFLQNLLGVLGRKSVPQANNGYNYFLQASRDLSIVAYTHEDKLYFWDFEEGRALTPLQDNTYTHITAWSPDNRYVWMYGVVDLQTGRRVSGVYADALTKMGAWSPDGRSVALAQQNCFEIYDVWLKTQAQTLSFTAVPDIKNISWASDSKRLAFWMTSQSKDRWQLAIWDTARGKVMFQKDLEEPVDKYASSAFSWSPDGRLIVAFVNKALHVYDAKRNYAYEKFPLNASSIDLAWSPDSTHLAMYLSSDDFIWGANKTSVWEFSESKHEYVWSRGEQGMGSYIDCLGWSKDGSAIRTIKGTGDISLVELKWR